MKYFLVLLIVFTYSVARAQERGKPEKGEKDSLILKTKPKRPLAEKDSISKKAQITIKDYQIISFARDTTFVDTTLTIQKEYRYNYLRYDDFELMPFSNVGQAYNKLGIDFERSNLYPNMGARAKHNRYREIEDINYYHVATPMTELFFKTTLEQGQLLDANLAVNTSKRFNFSIGYTGFRSLGKYVHDQVSSGNFITTTNYTSKNLRYALRAHIAAQDIDSQENGGLANPQAQFESGDSHFFNRPRVDVRFENAKNKVLGKRYYLDHLYKLVRNRKDSSLVEKTSLALIHRFNYETKYYEFQQDASNSYFGQPILDAIGDRARLKTMTNEIGVQFYNTGLGNLTGKINLYNYNYYFGSILIQPDGNLIQNQLKGEEISAGGDYSKQIKRFKINGDIQYTVSGNLTGTLFNGQLSYLAKKGNRYSFKVHSSSRMPNFNFLLYQSDYLNYNWQHTLDFNKEDVTSFLAEWDSERYGNLMAKYSLLDNYTYFAPDESIGANEDMDNAKIRPFQETSGLSYVKLKYIKEFKYGKFALANTLLYQQISQENKVLNLPKFVTRNTLYFSSDVFKRAMYLQTGITFKYFSSYTMDAYNPVLGEFYRQNSIKLGGYPLLDFFINARVQQTRIYLKAEHFNSFFSGYDYYAAPNYPYRDFVLRFGLVWNFFS